MIGFLLFIFVGLPILSGYLDGVATNQSNDTGCSGEEVWRDCPKLRKEVEVCAEGCKQAIVDEQRDISEKE
jgi:hypothetical protein